MSLNFTTMIGNIFQSSLYGTAVGTVNILPLKIPAFSLMRTVRLRNLSSFNIE